MKNALIFCFFFAVQIQAQTVDAVTETLTRGVNNDSGKVVRIYDWITKNIRYEKRSWQNRVEGDTTLWQEPYTVIVRKKAVCIGYAKLFQAMCRVVNVESELVSGLVKNNFGGLEREEHVWNAVKINGLWYLLDATWDEGRSEKFMQFFLIPPSVFIEKHYPDDPIWQLLPNAKTFACFLNNKDCLLKQPPFFNSQDSIATWLALDSIQKIKTKAERSLRYNPNSLEAMRNLANVYSTEAFTVFQTFANWRDRANRRLNVTENQEEVSNWLETVEAHLQQARFYYEQLIRIFGRKGEYTDAQFNRDLMLENLLKLENERRFVARFFKK